MLRKLFDTYGGNNIFIILNDIANSTNYRVSIRTDNNNLNLNDFILYCKDYLTGGGHPKACGATLTKAKYNSFLEYVKTFKL